MNFIFINITMIIFYQYLVFILIIIILYIYKLSIKNKKILKLDNKIIYEYSYYEKFKTNIINAYKKLNLPKHYKNEKIYKSNNYKVIYNIIKELYFNIINIENNGINKIYICNNSFVIPLIDYNNYEYVQIYDPKTENIKTLYYDLNETFNYNNWINSIINSCIIILKNNYNIDFNNEKYYLHICKNSVELIIGNINIENNKIIFNNTRIHSLRLDNLEYCIRYYCFNNYPSSDFEFGDIPMYYEKCIEYKDLYNNTFIKINESDNIFYDLIISIMNNHKIYCNNFINNFEYELEIKLDLLQGNFKYLYKLEHLKFLEKYNNYAYVLYLNKFIDKISTNELLSNNNYTTLKQFIIDVCKICNINNDRIIKYFTNIYDYNEDYYKDYEYGIYKYLKKKILKNNIDTINKKIFEKINLL